MIALLATVLYTGDAWRLIHDAQLADSTLSSLVHQALVGAFLWPVFVVGVAGVRRIRREFSPGRKPMRVISVRGNVMVETLIAMPVVFLLTFGLAQFAVNNTAAVMMNYATFTASRAAWIWEGEGDLSEAAERARVAAAVSLTPVAYGGRLPSAEAESKALNQARGIMVAAQYPSVFEQMGANGVNEGESLASNSTNEHPTLAGALVETSFKARTAQQMTAAYRATIVEVVEAGNDVETIVRYQHFIAMPLVGRVFGTYGVVQGKVGHWMLFERSYKRARMTRANRNIEDLVGEDLIPRLL